MMENKQFIDIEFNVEFKPCYSEDDNRLLGFALVVDDVINANNYTGDKEILNNFFQIKRIPRGFKKYKLILDINNPHYSLLKYKIKNNELNYIRPVNIKSVYEINDRGKIFMDRIFIYHSDLILLRKNSNYYDSEVNIKIIIKPKDEKSLKIITKIYDKTEEIIKATFKCQNELELDTEKDNIYYNNPPDYQLDQALNNLLYQE